jgi:hypothetical protein
MDEGAAAADADASLLAFLGPPGAADADAEVSVGKTSEHSGELAFQAPPCVCTQRSSCSSDRLPLRTYTDAHVSDPRSTARLALQ